MPGLGSIPVPEAMMPPSRFAVMRITLGTNRIGKEVERRKEMSCLDFRPPERRMTVSGATVSRRPEPRCRGECPGKCKGCDIGLFGW